MEIYKIIIHEVYKAQGSVGAVIRKSKSLLDVTNSDVIKLLNELDNKYKKRSNRSGLFDNESPTVFHEYYNSFHSDPSDDKFIVFSQKAAENLRDRIDALGPAKGGYLVFAHYFFYRPFCAVFFVRDTTSIAFKRNQTVDTFNLDKVEHIDIDKLAMACRINMEDYEVVDRKYLTFIQTNADQLSRYFVNWISTKNTVTSEEDTKNILVALKKIPLPVLHEAEDPRLKREVIIKKAYELIDSSPTKTIKVTNLSSELFEDENYLTSYLQEKFPNTPNEFKAHGTALKTFINIHATAKGVDLKVERFAIVDGTVRVDKKNSEQVIIKSAEIANQIQEAL